MLRIDRLNKIEEIMTSQGSVVVSKLKDVLGVSEETIRRDLDHLSKKLNFRRVHGGAYLVDIKDKDVPVSIRENIFLEEKRQIAGIALTLINDGDTVMLDSSTTAVCVAKAIHESEKKACIITNSIKVVNEFSGNTKVDIIGLGGHLRSISGSFVGQMATETLRQLSADKAFISCTAIHPEFALTDMHHEEALIRQLMVKRAVHSVLIADHTKFNQQATYKICDFHEIKTVIVDRFPNKKTQKFIESFNIQTLICDTSDFN